MPSCWPRFPPCLWAPSLDHTQSTTTKTVMEQHLQFCSCSFHARHLDSTLQPRLHSPAHVQLEGALELSYNQWNVHKCDMRPCINLAYKLQAALCFFFFHQLVADMRSDMEATDWRCSVPQMEKTWGPESPLERKLHGNYKHHFWTLCEGEINYYGVKSQRLCS